MPSNRAPDDAPDLETSFRLLDLAPGASAAEIRSAYRLLVNVWHPDRFQHDAALQARAQEKLKAINLAYAVLCRANPDGPEPAAAGASGGTAGEPAPAATEAPAPGAATRSAAEWLALGHRLTANPGRLRDEADHLSWSDVSNLDRFFEGVQAFREAVRLDPRLKEAWYGLGLAQLAMGEATEALEALQRVVRLDRGHVGAWVALGSAFGERGLFDRAAQAFEQAVRLRPQDAAAWYALGSVRVRAGDTESAVSAFRRAVERDPDLAEAWHSLGVALAFPGPEGRVEPEEAVAAFRQAVRLRPDLAEGWHGLGATLSGLGRHEEAIGPLQRAVRLRPDSAESWYSLGVAARYATNASASRSVHEAYSRLKGLDPAEAARLRELLPYSMRLSLVFKPWLDRGAGKARSQV
jgi:tetratricopeptide (TPR) repeat protein